MTALEKEVERRLRKTVERRGGLCLKWVCPGWRGVPDRIVVMPGGRVYFVELKRSKGGTYSPMQKWWHNRLRALGFWVACVHDDDGIATFDLLISN